ncbi:hypothetical protein E2562_032897 [Oryza meyeriana var. granulata]|uniref:Uncharacterized protein n=1 Tax=Oryza meyeriana var. granulata TaxID=110450 RepID=A0A6G1F0N9_9ORYZ|nr:hypothetical protein E2562_032897 [Oryza meyeriana var. granulata]
MRSPPPSSPPPPPTVAPCEIDGAAVDPAVMRSASGGLGFSHGNALFAYANTSTALRDPALI